MVLGDVCTRQCAFCAVRTGAPRPVDPAEPWKVAQAVWRLRVAHAVITSVTRDDLSDGGAAHIASTVVAVRSLNPATTIEILVPDFQGRRDALGRVLHAGPDVFGHNIETVARLHPALRDPRYGYDRSLKVLRAAAAMSPRVIVKSAFMVGLGETEAEVRKTLEDLLGAGCRVVNIGQYLRPTRFHREVGAFVTPEQFEAYERLAYALGFAFSVAGPFVRSSYRSGDLWSALNARRQLPAAGGRI
jgi:lipoic acid synthetase